MSGGGAHALALAWGAVRTLRVRQLESRVRELEARVRELESTQALPPRLPRPTSETLPASRLEELHEIANRAPTRP